MSVWELRFNRQTYKYTDAHFRIHTNTMFRYTCSDNWTYWTERDKWTPIQTFYFQWKKIRRAFVSEVKETDFSKQRVQGENVRRQHFYSKLTWCHHVRLVHYSWTAVIHTPCSPADWIGLCWCHECELIVTWYYGAIMNVWVRIELIYVYMLVVLGLLGLGVDEPDEKFTIIIHSLFYPAALLFFFMPSIYIFFCICCICFGSVPNLRCLY